MNTIKLVKKFLKRKVGTKIALRPCLNKQLIQMLIALGLITVELTS